MYKVDFYFLSVLARESCYTKIIEILKENYPNVKGFSALTAKNFCKRNDLPSRFFQSHVREMVRAGAEEV